MARKGWGEESGFRVESSQCGFARMAEREMEAARALAGLAEVREGRSGSLSGDDGDPCGVKRRRRGRKQGADEQRSQHPHQTDIEALSDPVQGCLLEDQERQKKVCKFLARKAVKAPEGWELLKSRFKYSTNQGTSQRRKSTQALSEADIDAKSLRRILANRESARQTIRRRQALSEELSKTSADLISDNERMKREKESVMREYKLLKDKNKLLKSQVAATMGKRDETPQEAVSILAEKSTSPSSSAQFQSFADDNKSPLPLLFWPNICCPHAHLFSQVPSESNNSVCDFSFIEPHKGLDPRNSVRGPMMPFCLIPCPWFYPSTKDGNQFHPSRGYSGDAEVVRTSEKEAKAQASSLCQVIPEESRGNHKIAEPSNMTLRACGVALTHSPWRPTSPHQPIKFSSVSAGQNNIQVPVSITNVAQRRPCKRLVDGVRAAEARKRRKEITKLKHLMFVAVTETALLSCGTCSKMVL